MKDGAIVQIGTPDEILTQPATGYVAEFVQDVDQGRVIDVSTVMRDAVILQPDMGIAAAVSAIGGDGGFVVDASGRPTGVLTPQAALQALAANGDLNSALRTDFDVTRPTEKFNHIYAAAGKGLPLAVVDDNGSLVAALHPREMVEEMGRVESLIDGFEREVFM